MNNLNSEQLAAVEASAGYNLIIASAGTGKTSTIVGRIVHLLKSGTAPSKILLLTFTNKAAGEMLSRLEVYFPKETLSQIESGTFHAVCFRWLKKAYPKLSLKQPGELRTLFRSIYDKRHFSKMNFDVVPFSAIFLYEQYSLYQNASLLDFDKWFLDKYPDHELLMDVYVDICDEFEKTKEQYGFLSFNDLLLKTKNHLLENKIEFEEVLVDEYQDTNTLQNSLIDTIDSNSLFCVGDYDQSIYAFNGANIENIATFATRYPNAKVFTLKKNYRSLAPILELANKVIERNKRIYPKSLEVGRKEEGTRPQLLEYEELFEQYQSISLAIKKSNIPNDKIAVIFRNNSSADGIEASLRELGLPCKRKGGTSFFDSKEIKFLLDFCMLAVNPKDMMAFIHIIEYGQGVGAAMCKDIFECLTYFGEGNAKRGLLSPVVHTLPKLNPNKNLQLGLFDDDIQIGSASRFGSISMSQEMRAHPILKYPKITEEGMKHFARYHELSRSIESISSPKSILGELIKSDFYMYVVEILATQRGRLKSGEVDQERKKQARENILRKADLLINLSRGYSDMARFVNAMILGGGELSEGEGVNLLTVHASKGLEFENVFVVDLMDSRFPNHKLMNKSGEGIDEERRLFYVAVTRAKNRLFLSYAKYDKVKKIQFKPSPFLYEAGLLKGEPQYKEQKDD